MTTHGTQDRLPQLNPGFDAGVGRHALSLASATKARQWFDFKPFCLVGLDGFSRPALL
jgi:hypothetical protein